MNSARLPREPVYGASLLATHIRSKGCSNERRKFLRSFPEPRGKIVIKTIFIYGTAEWPYI
uniref:Uncharacterized protein n=1 Tax=Heterorhabditis bacteriophora TaxID=37862 RepID=A0A1I7XK30_HETBA